MIHDPNTGFTCGAVRGRGAFVGSRRLALPPRPITASSNVYARMPVGSRLAPVVSGWLGRHKFRGFRSVALGLAYVALGAIDVLVDDEAKLWDIAAGAAAVLEAGGCVTDLGGRPLFPLDPASYRGEPLPLAAGNPLAHRLAVEACRGAGEDGGRTAGAFTGR